MTTKRNNYKTYVIMMITFLTLIYFAIEEGARFEHLSAKHLPAAGKSALEMFMSVISNNLTHPLTTLLLQIIVILFVVRIFSMAFRRIGQPGVIGEIVAGIVLGPSLIGYYFPEFSQWLFPPESLGNLQLFSQIGLVLFMFVIGMELDFKILKNKINETLVISHAGIVVPFFLGIIAAYWVYEEYASTSTAFLPFALFIGISMSITAFPVLARIVQERNMSKTPIGILSLASAANDDVTAWCLLAVVIAIAKAGTFVSALYAIGLTMLYILLMFMVVRPFLKKIGEAYANQEVINKTFVGFIFIIMILSSVITEVIGIHALFGAFMAGVVMPSNMGFRKVMMEKVEDIALVLFLPLFFAFTGLNTQIGLLNSPVLWGMCGLFILVSIAGKLGGCTLAARLVGESWRNSLIVGTLMNTRGLMELVALNIGREMGILSPEIFAILVIMALVTTFMTTPILNLVEKTFAKANERSARKAHLIFCFGRPETGRSLLHIARLLLGKELKHSEVVAAHFTQGTDLNPVNAVQYAKDSFKPIKSEASKIHISLKTHYGVTDKLSQDIVQLTQEKQANILFLGAGPTFMDQAKSEETPRYLRLPIISSLFKMVKESSYHLPGVLFREKLQSILEQVHCPVAIFVNRDNDYVDKLHFIFSFEDDIILLPYIEKILSEGRMISYTVLNDEVTTITTTLLQHKMRYGTQMTEISKESFFTHGSEKDNLLLLTYNTCAILAADTPFYNALPSLLVFSQPKECVLH